MSHLQLSRDNTIVTAALSQISAFSARSSAGSPALVRRLEDPMFRRWLSAIVSRRVPRGEADDVVQSVLCDALASNGVPSDDGEISKWIFGIARNKVADFHRRAKRAHEAHEEMRVGERSGELRVMLRAVVAEANETERNREALEWIVREHDGEELASIAEELDIPAPVVRQRVSRLRRALRERWLGASGVLVFMLASAAGISEWRSQHSRRSHEEIIADAGGSLAARAFLTDVDGQWKIAETAHFKADLSSEVLSAARVRITGAQLSVTLAGIEHHETIAIDEVRGNEVSARIIGENQNRNVIAKLQNGELVITSSDRYVRLVRP